MMRARLHLPLGGLLIAAMLTFVPTGTRGQGAIRVIVWNFEKTVDDGDFPTAYYGLGYDHDLNKRLSMGVEAMVGGETDVFTLRYRSAYHFTDNDLGSAYVGPMVAVRQLDNGSRSETLFPLGLRLGFRGSLPGSFADIFVGAQYQAGASGPSISSGNSYEAVPMSFVFGLHFGFGWEAHKE